MLNHLVRALLPLAAFFALQGSLLGVPAECALTGHHPATRGDVVASGAATSMVTMDEMADTPRNSGGAPCEQDATPGDCAAMLVCAAFAEFRAAHREMPAMPATSATAMVARAPAFLPLPPELPPPRS